MTDLTPFQARALRLKRADRVGDIANAQADIDAIDRELAAGWVAAFAVSGHAVALEP